MQIATATAPKNPALLKLTRLAALTLAVACLLAATHYAGTVLETARSDTPSTEYVYLPDARFLRIASLGHSAAVADILWFRTISYFGGHYRTDRSYPWLTKMCDLVTDLDPQAFAVYRFAGVILPWEANRPDDGIALLEKGLLQFPDSWDLHWLLGFNYYFFKDDLQKASSHLTRASQLPGAHPVVARLAAIIYAQTESPAAAASFLQQLAETLPDEATRRIVGQRVGELQLANDIDALTNALAQYRERTGAAATSLDDLVTAGIVSEIPHEPFGGRYVLDPKDGTVHNTSHNSPLRLYVSKAREEYRKGNYVHW
jgi:tetratricopeptide (TPR) repeat protein